MRITQILNRQNIGFMFKKHWLVQGQRKVLETSTAANLEARGFKITDPNEYISRLNEKPRET